MDGDVAADATGDLRAIGEIANLMQDVNSAVVALHPLDEDELHLDFLHRFLLESGVMDRLMREDTILDIGQIPSEDMTALFAFNLALIRLDFSSHEKGSAHRAFRAPEGMLVVFINPRLHSEPPCS